MTAPTMLASSWDVKTGVNASHPYLFPGPSGLLIGSTGLANRTCVKNSDPSHAASFSLGSDGVVHYQSASGFTGTDTFTCHCHDANGDSSVVTITFHVLSAAEWNSGHPGADVYFISGG